MKRELIPILIPEVPKFDEISGYFKQIDDARIYSNYGPLNSMLIHKLADYLEIDSAQITTVSNATLGLEGAIRTAKNIGSYWELPAWTFTATPAAAINAGAVLSFRDIDSEWRVKPSVEVKNLIDVLPFGLNVDISRLPDDLQFIVIDAAASFDSLKSVGSILRNDSNIAIVMSLHATKCLPAGEGGIVFSNRIDWIKNIKDWTNFGMDGDRISNFVGTNGKLSEYAAAVALSSLESWERIKHKNLINSKRALTISAGHDLKVTKAMETGFATPYWIIDCGLLEIKKKIEFEFEKANISTRSWWQNGCHKMPAYANYFTNDLTHTDLVAATSIGLPFHNYLTEENWTRIASTLAKVLT